MNRGEVWTLRRADGAGWRAVVVSSDGHNDAPGAWPYVAPLIHRPAGELPPYSVETIDPDPVGGVVLVAELFAIDPRAGASVVGTLTGRTVAEISEALRDLFDL